MPSRATTCGPGARGGSGEPPRSASPSSRAGAARTRRAGHGAAAAPASADWVREHGCADDVVASLPSANSNSPLTTHSPAQVGGVTR